MPIGHHPTAPSSSVRNILTPLPRNRSSTSALGCHTDSAPRPK